MVVGTFLLVYASSLTHPQDSLPHPRSASSISPNNFSMFTYGRVWPAAIDALVYGWASTAGLGLAVWLLARMSRDAGRSPGALMTRGRLLESRRRHRPDRHFPRRQHRRRAARISRATPRGSSGSPTRSSPSGPSPLILDARTGPRSHRAGWMLAALFAFPVALRRAAASCSAPHPLPGSGVIQELIGAWYVHGIYTLWLAPLGLGLLYYLIPKVSGLSIRFRHQGARSRSGPGSSSRPGPPCMISSADRSPPRRSPSA